MTKQNVVYILECADGSLYTGWTNDLEHRLRVHNAGQGGKYTRSHRPVKLVYQEAFSTKEEAMSREFHIKRMKRKEKLELITAKGMPQNGKLQKTERVQKTD